LALLSSFSCPAKSLAVVAGLPRGINPTSLTGRRREFGATASH